MIEEHFKCAVTGFDSETDRTYEYHQTPRIIEFIKQKIKEDTHTYLEYDETIDNNLVDEGLHITQRMLNDIKRYITHGDWNKE